MDLLADVLNVLNEVVSNIALDWTWGESTRVAANGMATSMGHNG